MPRRFHFPLQTLLRVRGLAEREAKRRVAAVVAEIARLDGELAGLQAEVNERQTALNVQQQQATVRPDDMARGRAWIVTLRQRIGATQQTLAERRAELAQRQSELAEARKQTRVIEKLRERRHETWKKNVSREEQSGADELARQLLQLRHAEPGATAASGAAALH